MGLLGGEKIKLQVEIRGIVQPSNNQHDDDDDEQVNFMGII